MSLAEHVRTLGRGPGRSRSLSRDEATDAMRRMLSPDAAPEAVGAVLMLLRMKGETADEIAGLAAAAQSALPDLPQPDLDWPSYAAGRSRGLPWFLLSARLVASAGYAVLLHGWNGADTAIRSALPQMDIPLTRSAEQAELALNERRIAYFPLEDLHPDLFRLLTLRNVLGLRSCVNTVSRMLNPGQAAASVQGVFHPSYRLKQVDAAAALGWPSLSVIKGGGGEFERNPAKSTIVYGLRDGTSFEQAFEAGLDATTRLAEGPAPDVTLSGLWSGAQTDTFAETTIVGTAALALATLGVGDAVDQARRLWLHRNPILDVARQEQDA